MLRQRLAARLEAEHGGTAAEHQALRDEVEALRKQQKASYNAEHAGNICTRNKSYEEALPYEEDPLRRSS